MSDAPCITAIKPTKRNPDRATVRVGKRVVGTLSVRSIAQLGLRVGQPWDAQLEEKITSTSVYDKAMRQAMNRLNRRMLSSKRLDDKLRDLGYEPDIRQRVLDRLAELKFIDDEAFGRALIRDITLRKAAGPRLLQQKLYQHGIARSLIEQLIRETQENTDDSAQALDLAQRKLRQMAKLDPAARRRRLYGQLARRGFTPDTIRNVMEQIADQLRDGTDYDY